MQVYWDTTMKNKDILFIEACERELNIREADPPYMHWVLDKEGMDIEGDFCPECVKAELARVKAELARVKAEQGEVEDDETRTIYEYPESESDGCRHCETCGALLAYTLTEYGQEEDLAHFEESGLDWNEPVACYEFNRIIMGVFKDETAKRVLKVLKRSSNRPAEVKIHLKRVESQHYYMPTLKSDLPIVRRGIAP